MWTRKELKDKAKASLKANYWKTVLVAMIVLAIGGGMSAATGSGITSSASTQGQDSQIEQTQTIDELEQIVDEYDDSETTESMDELPEVIGVMLEDELDTDASSINSTLNVVGPVIVFVLLVLVVAALAMAIAADVFIFNPIYVGTARFFSHNLNEAAQVKEVAWAYDHNYRETVKTLFWRDLRILLWGLLLIVPGIVKSYEYRMIPYLLADDPTMTKDRAFAESKRMMDGNKWRTFVLDLSFIGWTILSVLTLGLLSIFYVAPYKSMTDAALYERLRYGQTAPQHRMLTAETAPISTSADVPVPPFAAVDAPQPSWDEDYSEE